jgi:uncharacterized membrane protein YgdD (TMEM256/DUF423 family)
MEASRSLFALSGLAGFLGVALGAFGAHGLQARLAALAGGEGVVRLEWWKTAAQYHLVHALALGLAASLASSRQGRAPTVAGIAFAIGIVLFSGSLYTMTLTGIRVLGAVTPLGGVAFLIGWIALGLAGYRP